VTDPAVKVSPEDRRRAISRNVVVLEKAEDDG
jgi:hypothetical protein